MENKILISFLTIYHYKFHVSSDNKNFIFKKRKKKNNVNFEHRIQSLNRFAEKRNGIDTTHESPRYVTF